MDPVTAILGLGAELIKRLFPDPAQAASAQLELLKLQQSGELAGMIAQTDINKVEAASTNWFVAGWRPAVGWVCVAGLAYQLLVYPLAASFYPHMVQLDGTTLTGMLTGLLGLGGLRTIEKINGQART